MRHPLNEQPSRARIPIQRGAGPLEIGRSEIPEIRMHRKSVAGLPMTVAAAPHVDILTGGRQPARHRARVAAHAPAFGEILRSDYVNDSHARDNEKTSAAGASGVSSRSIEVLTCSGTF